MNDNQIREEFAILKKLKHQFLSDSERNIYRSCKQHILEFAKPEHIPEYGGQFMSDWIDCSCGWQSTHYWDGADFAMDDWYQHVRTEVDRNLTYDLY